MMKRKTRKIILMLICCLLVGGLTSGCKPNKKNKKITYSAPNRKIVVNMANYEVKLTNVRIYDDENNKQRTLTGKGLIHSGWYDGASEVDFIINNNTYAVKVKISGDQVKVNYKDGNYYDTYKK